MPALPANFFTRTELQALVRRAHRLVGDCEGELNAAVGAMLAAAAGLEGLLADTEPTRHPNDKALANPHDWWVEWVDQSWEFITGTVVVARQFMVAPDEQKFPTGRFRVTIGEQGTFTSADTDYLSGVITGFLMGDLDTLPTQLVESCLNSLED